MGHGDLNELNVSNDGDSYRPKWTKKASIYLLKWCVIPLKFRQVFRSSFSIPRSCKKSKKIKIHQIIASYLNILSGDSSCENDRENLSVEAGSISKTDDSVNSS